MIKNDVQLAVVRKQLGHVERALESLRNRVLPKNPRNFEIYSEAYVAQINILKAEIDEYLPRTQVKVPDTASTPTTRSENVS